MVELLAGVGEVEWPMSYKSAHGPDAGEIVRLRNGRINLAQVLAENPSLSAKTTNWNPFWFIPPENVERFRVVI